MMSETTDTMTHSTKRMKLQASLALALSLLLAALPAHSETEQLDKVIAIVGEDVVLQSELRERIESVMQRLRESGNPQLPSEDELRDQILDQLVLERLQIEMGRRYDITVSEQQVDQAIERILQNNQITKSQLEAELAQQGQSFAGFRDKIHRDLWVSEIQRAVVNSRIEVNERDIESFLASTDGKFATAPDYHLGHILLSVDNDAGEAEVEKIRKKAESIRQELMEGADFSQMAITHSNDARALEGGDMGWRKLEQLPTLFADVVSEMAQGNISEPIRSGAGFHILKVHETRGGGKQIVEQTKARHILIKTSEILGDEQAEAKLRELRQRALEGEDFAQLAREHSEDTGSMLQGGDLGWANPGQMVPAFDRTMQETPIGEISEPFKSRFGWHILLVEDRREKDLSDLVLRNQAANMLRERRFDEELQSWLAEIRDEIYVEVKI